MFRFDTRSPSSPAKSGNIRQNDQQPRRKRSTFNSSERMQAAAKALFSRSDGFYILVGNHTSEGQQARQSA